jgi:hypothetical protein
LISYNYNRNVGLFECSWEENSEIISPTRIYIPDLNSFSESKVLMEPYSDKFSIESIPNSNAGYLLVNPFGQSVRRNIIIEFTNP